MKINKQHLKGTVQVLALVSLFFQTVRIHKHDQKKDQLIKSLKQTQSGFIMSSLETSRAMHKRMSQYEIELEKLKEWREANGLCTDTKGLK